MQYSGINIQGNIISTEILEKIRNEDLAHQRATDFGLDKSTQMREEIGYAWQAARLHWQAFQLKRERLGEKDTGASETRSSWIIPLLTELGYQVEKATADIVDGKSYAISHRATNRNGFPIHIMGVNDLLDKRRESGGPRLSPHALVQEYLNNTEHLYALVSNGRFLRLLRDATRLTRLSYLEFDLERIMEEELYPDFALLYRLLHFTRMPEFPEESEKSIIEEYHQLAIETGARIRDKLRDAVEEAMKTLANGWLQHPDNYEFAEAVREGRISPADFYQGLLRVIYRLLFIIVIEERGLIFAEPEEEKGKKRINRLRRIYRKYYSLERLHRLAVNKHFINGRKTDLWQSVRATFSLFDSSGRGRALEIQPLGGELFDVDALKLAGFDLAALRLYNRDILEVIEGLTLFEDEDRQRVRVNYSDLDVEELGSVYEALLDLAPNFSTKQERVLFGFRAGTERKITGSYYTRGDLVQELIQSALVPVIEERLEGARSQADKEEALLSLKVCDPAVGSGHFLLAAARRIATEVARVRSEEDNPGEAWYRPAIREVIQRCIYGVDKNPPATELCRFSLWLEGHTPGRPLSFLDHKIRVGDSLVGVDRLERLQEGIPNDAFKPITGDDKKAASYYKKINRDFLKSKQLDLFAQSGQLGEDLEQIAEAYKEVARIREETLEEQRQKRAAYEKLRQRGNWMTDWTACNLFTYAFFQPLTDETPEHLIATSETLARHLKNPGATHSQLVAKANAAALELRFFHWPLEFPEVFGPGKDGFDVMLGNPPWERIKVQEKEFFANKSKAIVGAPNKATREDLIKALMEENPKLYDEYQAALHYADGLGNFIRYSERYPLTSSGDINTYSVFSGLFYQMVNKDGRSGFIVPTGIATDYYTQDFFGDIVEQNRLVSLYDFENRRALFPNVHRSYKFCLLTLKGGPLRPGQEADFGFFLQDPRDLEDEARTFSLSREGFLRINPNTKTCPVFRTRQDAELTKKIYRRAPVLINEETGENPWGISFMRMFDMSNDSHLFKTRAELEEAGFALRGNRFVKGEERWLPLYEAKMVWQYDHRYGSYGSSEKRNDGTNAFQYHEQNFESILPWYWIKQKEIAKKIERNDKQEKKYNWFIGFRDIARSTDERTVISSLFPLSGVSNKLPCLFSDISAVDFGLLLGNLCSFVLDFNARQKVGGTSLNFYLVEQFPSLPREVFSKKIKITLIPKVLELTYTAWDIKAFADDLWREADEELRAALQEQWEDNKQVTGGHEWDLPDWRDAYPEIAWERNAGCPLPPFKWDEARRARLQAELDAYYARLYGLTRDELRYILDPQDVMGEDFPGETFRVLKGREMREYGEYRTGRLVLEAWDGMINEGYRQKKLEQDIKKD